MFISGMGFFTDAYDLFIIGVVISMAPFALFVRFPRLARAYSRLITTARTRMLITSAKALAAKIATTTPK